MHPLADCTHHARVRMQQRGIDAAKLDLLMAYGRASHDHRGHVLMHMDRRAVQAGSIHVSLYMYRNMPLSIHV